MKVASFFIDQYEVTVAEYKNCVDAGKCSTENLDKNAEIVFTGCNWGNATRLKYPINCVDKTQADAYCEWAKKRLPTEAEWEYAAKGSTQRKYPWGNTTPERRVCWGQMHLGYGCEVGHYPADQSPFGVHDMSGSVAEWTSTPGENEGLDANFNTTKTKGFVARGGTWYGKLEAMYTTTFRQIHEPSYRLAYLGFRCAK